MFRKAVTSVFATRNLSHRALVSKFHTLSKSSLLSAPKLKTFGAVSTLLNQSIFKKMSKRSMFIQTQDTPNPNCLMFVPGREVMPSGTADFPNFKAAQDSPLAASLFKIEGVTSCFFTTNYIAVSIDEDSNWEYTKPEVFAAISNFFSSGQEIVGGPENESLVITDDDDEVVAFIKEVIETRVRPGLQEHGGDLVYIGLDPNGIVWLKLQGSCVGCPSSTITMKRGVEKMLTYYVPEVEGVEEFLEEWEVLDQEELSSVNEGLAQMIQEQEAEKHKSSA